MPGIECKIFDAGNSAIKPVNAQVDEAGVLVSSSSENLLFIGHKEKRQIVTNKGSYAFTSLKDPQAFLAEFAQLAQVDNSLEDTEKTAGNLEILGLTGFNNWLVIRAQVVQSDGLYVDKTVVVGENPSLSIPLDDSVIRQLTTIYEASGEANSQEKISSLQSKKHYLLHSLTAVTQDQELLYQLLDVESSAQISQIEYGDFQGWLMNSIHPSINLGFTPQNLRSLGARNDEQAGLILRSCFNINNPVVHSAESLGLVGVFNENDLSAEIKMLKAVVGDGSVIYVSFDSVLKIITFGLEDLKLPSQLSEVSYLTQRTGGAIGSVSKPLLEAFGSIGNVYEIMGDKILSMLRGGLAIPDNYLFYPVEDDFGKMYARVGNTWQNSEINNLNGQTDSRLIAEMKDSIGDDIDEFIMAVILGMVFAARQKVEDMIQKSDVKKQLTIMLGGGLVGYNKSWEALSAIIFSQIEGVEIKKLEGFQGAHQALLWCIMQAIINGEFIQIDVADDAQSLLFNTVAQNIDKFLPKMINVNITREMEDGQVVSPSEEIITAIQEHYQFWLSEQDQKVSVGAHAQLYGSN